MSTPLSLRLACCTIGLCAGVAIVSGCAQNDPIHLRNVQELRQLEACGYQPGINFDPWYPSDLQQAQVRMERGECGA